MNKLLVLAVLVALLALGAESFRVPRQVDEEQGALSKMADTVKSYYDSAVSTAGDYVESIKNLRLDEKAKKLYTDTATVVSTYTGIAQDQIYHILYPQQ
ncbi:apolipoprotein C-II [Betta splendens]|uniref:Apolipoprotein C-II n=1 Tax=Betta splendens TaxID=158456 RepID=A0A6P7KXF6_BETSP|nr:apolipoprotein C-II [Betta splendens]XP_055359000.1 apolipoprotein C-II [Betta splendens]